MTVSVWGVCAAAVGGAALWMLWSWRHKKSPSRRRVGTVSRLFVYPVKSLAGVMIDEAVCTPVGLQIPETDVTDRFQTTGPSHDMSPHSSHQKYYCFMFKIRSWHLVITSKDYDFICQRQQPSLALIQISVQNQQIHLEAPNMDRLTINRDGSGQACTVRVHQQPISAVDCGQDASDWLSSFLHKDGVRLCIAAPGPSKRILRDCNVEPFKTYLTQRAKKDDQIIFSDTAPFMLVSDASLEDLNSRMNVSLTMRSFRPNITVSGCPAYDEDSWGMMEIGDARFKFIFHCSRCIFTQVDPDTGTRRKDQEPLKTLRTYRLIDPAFENSPCFGTQWVLEKPGVIHVGDPVYMTSA